MGSPDVDVHMERFPGGDQPGAQSHPYAAVLILVADHLCGDRAQVKGQTVVQVGWERSPGDLDDGLPDVLEVVGGVQGREVDVRGGPAELVGGQQHAALEHEPVAVGGVREPQ